MGNIFIEDEEFDINTKWNPKNFDDFLRSDNLMNSINATCTMSIGDIFLMILKFSIANSLPSSGMVNLVKLINTILGTDVIPGTKYLIDKLLNPKSRAEFHAVCENCSMYLGEFSKVLNVKQCPTCNCKLNLQNPCNKNFFVLIDPSTQIADLLEMYEVHYEYVIKDRKPENNIISDVYDGKQYRKFVKSLPSTERYNYVSTVFNTDGAEKFKSSKSSIWPIYLMINELPAQERLRKLVTCGLWINRKKPNLGIFLHSFVLFLKKNTESGISCTIKGEKRVLSLYVIQCCVDTVARAPTHGIIQFNGYHGCSWCLQEGKYAANSVRYSAFESAPPRTPKSTVENMLRITEASKKEKQKILKTTGIKHPCPLMNLPKYPIIQGFSVDYLHCFLEGVVKQVTNHHLEGLSEEDIMELDDIMLKISVPHQLARLTRGLSLRGDWNARELENWALYYSVPIFKKLLSDTLMKHWLLLVNSLHILLKKKIGIDELNKADTSLRKFVADCEQHFGLECMTYNVHLLTHISQSVLNWGPLWAQSTFPFESENHNVLKAIKCSAGVISQIVRYVNNYHYTIRLQEHIYKFSEENDMVKMYCEDILRNRAQKTLKISSVSYFGAGNEIFPDLTPTGTTSQQSLKVYQKMIKNGCLYEGECRHELRSNNSYARLSDGRFIHIIEFIVNESTSDEMTVCNILNTEYAFRDNHEFIQRVIGILEERAIVQTKDINIICVHMQVETSAYICPVPNDLHYCNKLSCFL